MAYTRILVWLDDSRSSIAALRQAIGLAKEHGAEIHSLTVQAAPHYQGAFGDIMEAPPISTGKYDRLVQAARAVAQEADIDLRPHLAFGSKGKAAKEFIEENTVDLLVVGYAKTPPFCEWFAGSTFRRLVRLAPCPVLVVKQSLAR